MRKNLYTGALVLAGGLAMTESKAADLFSITADAPAFTHPVFGAQPPVSQTISDKNVVDLVRRTIAADGLDTTFQNRPYTAFLNYAGVHDSMRFSVSPTGTAATLTIPVTGFSRTFVGPTRESVEDQLEEFVQREGQAELARFIEAMNRTSKFGPTDGNPGSATAQMADQSYFLFAQEPGQTKEEKESGDPEPRTEFGMVGDVGRIDAGGFKGTTYSLPLYANFKPTDRIGLNVNIPLNYTEIEGSQIFNVGLGLGLPIKILKRAADQPWNWVFTPSGGTIMSGSYDFAAGGMIAQGAASSMLSYDCGPVTFSMGNHFSYLEGIKLDIGDYSFDPAVSQQIMKNGLKVSIPFANRWIGEIYGIYTYFLQDAATKDYYTVGGEIGYRMGSAKKKKRGYVKLGIYSHLADDYKAPHAQFGTAFKF